MEIFSEENLEKLSDEHAFVCKTIARLQQDAYYVRTYGGQAVQSAINDKMIRKIQLEAEIETLTDHLHG